MNEISITERALHPHDFSGTVRIFIPNDPTGYGYWFPEDQLGRILTDDKIKEVYRSETTIVVQVNDEQIQLIRTLG